MKYLRILYVLMCVALVGCSNDEELVEWPDVGEGVDLGVRVAVLVQDADGNSLYSDDYNGILDLETLSETVTYTYRGETKALVAFKKPAFTDDAEAAALNRSTSKTDADPTLHEFMGSRMVLAFGVFYPWKSNNETFTINWPDGTHSKVEFKSANLEYPYTDRPDGWIKVRLDDGGWVDSDFVTIVK